VFQFREPPPPQQRYIQPLDGAPTSEQLEEEGAWAEPRRRLKLRRQGAEHRDRIRLEQELGHKIAPRVLDSRWDDPPVGQAAETRSSEAGVLQSSAPAEPPQSLPTELPREAAESQPSASVEPQQNLPTEPATEPQKEPPTEPPAEPK